MGTHRSAYQWKTGPAPRAATGPRRTATVPRRTVTVRAAAGRSGTGASGVGSAGVGVIAAARPSPARARPPSRSRPPAPSQPQSPRRTSPPVPRWTGKDLVDHRGDRVMFSVSPRGRPRERSGGQQGAIAQLVERLHGMQEVRSSILLSSTAARQSTPEGHPIGWPSFVCQPRPLPSALRSPPGGRAGFPPRAAGACSMRSASAGQRRTARCARPCRWIGTAASATEG